MHHDDATPCSCGHRYVAHEHYRAGTDCSLCPPDACHRFRPAGAPVAGLRVLVAAALREGRGRRSHRAGAGPQGS